MRIIPSLCSISRGFGCSDSKATADTFEMTLRYVDGMNMTSASVSYDGDVANSKCDFAGDENWTAIADCQKGVCNTKYIGNSPVHNNTRIGHIVFMQCGNIFQGFVEVNFTITYVLEGETTNKKTVGYACLKVES
jgi:hypothetical protein